jgi:tight adherence protein C
MTLTLPVLQLALIAQLALFGSLLIYGALTGPKHAIIKRVGKIKSPLPLPVSPKQKGWTWSDKFGDVMQKDIPAEHRQVLDQLLVEIGVPSNLTKTLCGLARLFIAIAVTGLIYGLLIATVRVAVPGSILLGVAALAGVLGGVIGFRRWASSMSHRRRMAVTRKIPYALELILIFLDAGLGLTTAFERVADALEERQPELNKELKLTLADLRVLGSQDLAFKNMAERINTPSMHSIVNILRQSIQYGSPISEAMQNAITLMRRTEILLMEEQANKLPSKITLMTLLFIFPPFVIILAAPAMIGLTSALTNF